ncbi:MAG: hypothetical protein M9894_39065, partial [Planctomycetes bacterium]|nr:hypothetical protein [Planctomycetota bacterium]
MRGALNLAWLSGALALGGAVHASARAHEAAPGLALGLLVLGLALGPALIAALSSRRAEDRDLLPTLLNLLAAALLGPLVERRLTVIVLPPGAVHGALVLGVALYMCLRIGLRRGDLSALATPDLVQAALASDRALDAAVEHLPARPEAPAAVLAALPAAGARGR